MNKNKLKEDEEDDSIGLSVDDSDELRDPDFKKDVDDVKNKTGKDVKITVGENEIIEPEAVIEPQDQATIKYLSNVKDSNTGETSQPFTIRDKKYQMVRGITPEKEIVMGVYCFDDMDEAGDNIIHSVDFFDENVATPYKNECIQNEEMNYSSDEVEHQDKLDYEDDLASDDAKTEEDELKGFKFFIVNTKTGDIVFKAKTANGAYKSGINGKDLAIMTVKELKDFRFGVTNKGAIEKLKELEAKAKESGVSLRKLTKVKSEGKVITKNNLIESVNKKKVIKTIKVKDI